MKIVVHNIVTEYEDTGTDRPVLVLLHGWKSNLRTFAGVESFLRDTFRIVRLDMPGFGKTESPDSVWGVIEYAHFVKAFVLKLGIKEYSVIGHSFGGRVIIKGQAMGVLHARKIILIDSAGVAQRKTLKNIAYGIVAKVGRVITIVPPLSSFRNDLKSLLYRTSGSDYLSAGVLKDIFIKTIREDLRMYAQMIRIPTLILWGSLDTTTPVSEGKLLHRLIPCSTCEVLDGAGHFVHEEKPQEVAYYIKKFI